MTAFLIRRIFYMIVVVFVVSLFMYFLFSVAPGGPLTGLAQQQRRLTAEDRARIRAQYELDLHWAVRYTRWLAGFPSGPIVINGQTYLADLVVGCYIEATPEEGGGCRDTVTMAEIPDLHPPIKSNRGLIFGDFGKSTVIQPGQSVWELLWSRMPATVELQVISLSLSLLIGIPLGIYSAVRQYSRFDYIFTTLAFIGSSMPTLVCSLFWPSRSCPTCGPSDGPG
jgi:peptide/nickel transport system permease protein